MFPTSTILANINGQIYDFSNYMYLDMSQYIINYVIKFSDIVSDDYWYFSYDGKKITIYTKSGNKKHSTFIIDKFVSCRMKLGLMKDELYDEKSYDKIMRKG